MAEPDNPIKIHLHETSSKCPRDNGCSLILFGNARARAIQSSVCNVDADQPTGLAWHRRRIGQRRSWAHSSQSGNRNVDHARDEIGVTAVRCPSSPCRSRRYAVDRDPLGSPPSDISIERNLLDLYALVLPETKWDEVG